MLEQIKSILELIKWIDEKVGFWKSIVYSIIGLIIIAAINYKTILKSVVISAGDISSKVHRERLEKRDELLTKLYPILTDLRSEAKADRLLYFEYHNSKENMVSIPFKYFALVQQTTRHDVPPVYEEKYGDLNTGAITDLYNYIKRGDIVYCSGEKDRVFRDKFPGTWTLFNSRDNSSRQLYVGVPGINQPVGFIVIEWIDEVGEEISPVNIPELEKIISHHYIPTINGLILSMSDIRQ